MPNSAPVIAFRPSWDQPASTQRSAWSADALEWEDLPSLSDSLAQRLIRLGERHSATSRSVPTGGWAPTLPAELEPPMRSQPFREPLEGLAVREVTEPDVFRHFFGTGSALHNGTL